MYSFWLRINCSIRVRSRVLGLVRSTEVNGQGFSSSHAASGQPRSTVNSGLTRSNRVNSVNSGSNFGQRISLGQWLGSTVKFSQRFGSIPVNRSHRWSTDGQQSTVNCLVKTSQRVTR
ncbi:hypothetical protein HanRHA438_Chr07g0325691 [Helianthus annuus]|nr:hypothetical protein HanRHA438_Chr07g0325691 [Helianthus annuus]